MNIHEYASASISRINFLFLFPPPPPLTPRALTPHPRIFRFALTSTPSAACTFFSRVIATYGPGDADLVLSRKMLPLIASREDHASASSFFDPPTREPSPNHVGR